MRNIKPFILVLSLAGTASTWSAENQGSNVSIYGAIDLGMEMVSGKLASTKGEDDTQVRVSSGTSTPHWGIRGDENLGGGLKASFQLESSFSGDTGAIGHGGRAFGRQANVSLSGPYGTVKLGRQYTMFYYGVKPANPFGTGSHGIRLLDPRITNPRHDNAISYLGKWGPVSGGVSYSFGWDGVAGNSAVASNCLGEAADSQQCRAWSAYGQYDGGSWGAVTSYERLNGGTSATFGGLTSPDLTDTRTTLGGYMKFAEGKQLTVGLISRNNMGSSMPKSDLIWVEGVLPVGKQYVFDGVLGQLKYENSSDKALLLNLRGKYILSKRTYVYLTAAFMNNAGASAVSASAASPILKPVAGASQQSFIAGIYHKF